MGLGSSKKAESKPPKRVCIIGGGAAGMACAWSLARFPERFDVELWESNPVAGGVASSCEVTFASGEKFPINDQVQGGAPSYRNNLMFFEEFGFKPHPVVMKICFGVESGQWTNHTETELVRKLQPEIARFGRVLKWVKRFEPIFVFVPIARLLKSLGFSESFRNDMVFPLTALFFGTGNQTPNVSAAVIARVFLDPDLRLFQYCPKRLLNETPEMFAFPHLETIFQTIADRIEARVFRDRKVTKVVRHRDGTATVSTDKGHTGTFDEVVFACDAETILKVLEKPRWIERKALGNVQYFNDLIVTHEDEAYMRSHYHLNLEDEDMYFVRTAPDEQEKIEMSFNLSMYQPHLLDAKGQRKNIYQSIFLNDAEKQSWTEAEIDKSKILKSRWTRQFAHTYKHFSRWVPLVRFLQGRKHTWFCGAYTLFNTHEMATMSGLAVAERLGAPYPYVHDTFATKQFDTYMAIVHGVRRKRVKQAKAAVGTRFAVAAAVGGAAVGGAPTATITVGGAAAAGDKKAD